VFSEVKDKYRLGQIIKKTSIFPKPKCTAKGVSYHDVLKVLSLNTKEESDLI